MSLRINNKSYANISASSETLNIKMEEDNTTSDSTELLQSSECEEDYVVKSIGAFGCWQGIVCVIAACTRFAAIWNMLSIIFLTPSTVFSCTKLEVNSSLLVENSTCYNDCVEYTFFDEVFEEDSLISEFGLICEDAWKASFTQSMLMFGFLIGVWLFGWISDRFGRRIGLLTSSSINVALMLAAPFAPSYWVFNSFRLLIGMASGGTMVTSLVFILEVVGPNQREVAGSLAIMPDGIAEALLALFAYFSPNWRVYLFGYSIVSFLMYLFFFFLPESPRWLMSKGKAVEAIEVLTRAAKWNKLETVNIRHNVLKALDEMKINDKDIHKATYLDLFSSKDLAFKIIASIVIWTSAGVCYFGINQYVTYISSNVYLTVILLGAVQTPTCPLAMIFNKTIGRKATTLIALYIIGVTMSILIFVPPGHSGCTVLGIIGFAATCTLFAVLCVYVSELFPTPLRTMAYGLSSGGAKIGAMAAPFIATINPHWIPSLFFAILPYIGSIFCVFLPETKGRKLQHTF